jgi:formate dehydrogenase assembly factor FdhD
MDIGEMASYLVMGLVVIERIVNRKPNKALGEVQQDIQKIKVTLEMRKEENSITLDASEAAIDAAISLGQNGPCHDAKKRITKYRKECLEHRL